MIYILYCSSSFEATELAAPWHSHVDQVKAIPLPCSGRLDILYLTKAFETGVEGIAVVVCPEGECRYVEGNMRARKRVDAVETLLEETGLGRGRATVIQLGAGGTQQVLREIAAFRDRIMDTTNAHKATAGTR
jgi:coenzyme F420-reducing hydrogenase delta subunit